MNAIFLSRGLLLFWSSWFSVVFFSNLSDGLRQAGLLSAGWRFTSGNFVLIAESIAIYSLSEAWAVALFSGVVLIQLCAAILFWRAFLDPEAISTRARPKVLQAFSLAIGLFSALLVADEVFVVYGRLPSVEATHLLVLCALLLSLLVIHRIDKDPEAA